MYGARDNKSSETESSFVVLVACVGSSCSNDRGQQHFGIINNISDQGINRMTIAKS